MREKNKWINMAALLALFGIICYYDLLFELSIILIFLADGYLLGRVVKVNGEAFEQAIVRTGLGLGMIGLIIYYILLAGVGNQSVYLVLLVGIFLIMGSIAVQNSVGILELKQRCSSMLNKSGIQGLVLLIVFGIYLVFASAPIDAYDALAKHLPISIYAADFGKWYTNVTESIVYGEPMVLYYTYAAVFISFGAYKAVALFNAILYWGAFFITAHLCKKIFANTNLWILMVIYFTTPFFLCNSKNPCLEVLSYFFAICAVAVFYDFKEQRVWDNLECIALLFGFSIFTKLTNIFFVVVAALFLAVNCFKYRWGEKKQVFNKMLWCGILGILPSIGSLIYIWVRTGNPVYPFLNAYFKSPYFIEENFSDPFQHKLHLSWQSVVDIVFHTDQNIEMYPLGMGIFLLFVWAIPLAAVILLRKKEHLKGYTSWVMLTVIIYRANLLSTYNLRYQFTNWVIAAGIIAVSLSVILSQARQRVVYGVRAAVTIGVLFMPNAYYLKQNTDILETMHKDESITDNLYCKLLDNVPEQSRVLAITNGSAVKGTYRGFFSSTTWHNYFWIQESKGKNFWKNYISSFDYILVDENCNWDMLEEQDQIDESMVESFLGAMIVQNQAGKVYQVKPKREKLIEQDFKVPVKSTVSEPVVGRIEVRDCYLITEDIINETDKDIPMRFQINWMDKSDQLIEATILQYNAKPGKYTYCSPEIELCEGAAYGVVYVCPAAEGVVKVSGYVVEGTNDFFYEIQNQYANIGREDGYGQDKKLCKTG